MVSLADKHLSGWRWGASLAPFLISCARRASGGHARCPLLEPLPATTSNQQQPSHAPQPVTASRQGSVVSGPVQPSQRPAASSSIVQHPAGPSGPSDHRADTVIRCRRAEERGAWTAGPLAWVADGPSLLYVPAGPSCQKTVRNSMVSLPSRGSLPQRAFPSWPPRRAAATTTTVGWDRAVCTLLLCGTVLGMVLTVLTVLS